MGKRKKAARKPGGGARPRAPLGEEIGFSFLYDTHMAGWLDTTFTCLFCHHDNSVTVRFDRKEGVAQLVCRVCDQRYQSKVNRVLMFSLLSSLEI